MDIFIKFRVFESNFFSHTTLHTDKNKFSEKCPDLRSSEMWRSVNR